MNKLKLDQLELDEDDERDSLIVKLQEVNEKLKFKLKDLEVMVENTVEKAYKAAKGNINTHREWDTGDETLKQKDKQLREYQAQIEACKKTVRGLRNKLNALTNTEKMVNVNNELKDAERRRKALEDEVKILKKNNKYQEKALGKLADDTDYESKMHTLSEELNNLKDEYKTMGKEHKAKEMAQMEHHKKLVSTEEENARLKRILIALKNHKDPFEGLNNMEDIIQGGKKEVETYESAVKSEEKRHVAKMKKLEESKEEIKKEIEELEKQIQDAEQENHETADKIKTKKQMIKENQDKMKKLLLEQREAEEKAREVEEREKLEEEKRLAAEKENSDDEMDRDDRSDGSKSDRSRGRKHSKDRDSNFYDDKSEKDKTRKSSSKRSSPKRNKNVKEESNSPLSSKQMKK